MKRITYGLMSTLTALVLLFGYRTSTSSRSAAISPPAAIGAASTSSATSSSSATSGIGTSSSGSTASAPGSSGSASSASSGTSATSTTVTGSAADTRFGPVQVQLTVKNGKITNVTVVEYPNNNGRDQEINANALPILINETLSAQNASIDMVGGATYTSEGYLTSLQSALDQAGL